MSVREVLEVHLEDRGWTDAELMRAFRGGSAESFAALVGRHQRGLVGFFLRLGADRHSAEDCAQETFLRLHRYRDRYRPSAPFAAFLYRLARNAWIDWRRRAAVRAGAVAIDGPEEPPARAEPGADDRLDLRAALGALPDGQRWVVLLAVDRGLSYAEIAAILGIPEGTVKSRMFHAVRKLREVLRADVDR